MKSIIHLVIALASIILSTASVFADIKTEGFKSLAQIEAALNPLEMITNHDGIRRSIDLNIQFSLNSANILPAAQRQIDVLGKALTGEMLGHCIIKLTGHTDATGDADDNLALSKQRASAVKRQLVKQYDVLPSQLIALGKGESQLLNKLAPNDAKHRRVEISLGDAKQCKKSANLNQEKHKKVSKDENGKLKIDW